MAVQAKIVAYLGVGPWTLGLRPILSSYKASWQTYKALGSSGFPEVTGTHVQGAPKHNL